MMRRVGLRRIGAHDVVVFVRAICKLWNVRVVSIIIIIIHK